MFRLKQLINIFYPVDDTGSTTAIGKALPQHYKEQFEKVMRTFIDFTLDNNTPDETVDKKECVDLKMVMSKISAPHDKKHLTVIGLIGTPTDDLDVNLNIQYKDDKIISFSVYISKISGNESDLVFKLESKNKASLIKTDLYGFASHVVDTLF